MWGNNNFGTGRGAQRGFWGPRAAEGVQWLSEAALNCPCRVKVPPYTALETLCRVEPTSFNQLWLKPVTKLLLTSTGVGKSSSVFLMNMFLIQSLCSWVCTLVLFSLYSGKYLLELVRSDVCRYIQLLFSLISEALVKGCCRYI